MSDFEILKKLRQICTEEDKHEVEWLLFIVCIVGEEGEPGYEQRKSVIFNKYKEAIMQYCELCGQITNCTEDCKQCIEETEKDFYEDLLMEQTEQM